MQTRRQRPQNNSSLTATAFSVIPFATRSAMIDASLPSASRQHGPLLPHSMDTDADTLTASFRLSAAIFLSSIDPDAAASHVHASFTDGATPSPLHCPRCARPTLTTRTMPTKTSRTRVRKQNTMHPPSLIRRSSKRSRRIKLCRSCSICAYKDEKVLVSDPEREHEKLTSGRMQTNSEPNGPSAQSSNWTALKNDNFETPKVFIEGASPKPKEVVTRQNHDSESTPKKLATSKSVFEIQSEHPSKRSQTDNDRNKSTPQPSTTSSKRSKKKEGLQAMLQRSKEQRDKAKQTEGTASGLAAFLSSL